MMHIRRVLTGAVALAALAGGASALVAQDNQQEQRDIQALVQLVDAVSAGKQPAPGEVDVAWVGNHFVKGADGSTYIPFSLSIGGGAAPAGPVGLYVRAVEKGAAPAAQGDQQAGSVYPWDDIQFITISPDGRVSRALMLKPGEYDLFIAVREATTQERNQPAARAGLLQRTLSVPDFEGDGLSVSTPIIATTVEPLPTPLSAEEQRANPYTFGGSLRVVPSADATLTPADDLQLLFWVYGAAANNGVPDLQIEYNFHHKTPEGEKFFNKTQPQAINASTLPPGFNVAAGHQVLGFLGVSLKSFPPGEYRVEITVSDKLSGNTLTENAAFVVRS